MTSSLGCVRKAVLEERFPSTSNAKAVEGTLLHDLLQVQRLHAVLIRIRLVVAWVSEYSRGPEPLTSTLCRTRTSNASAYLQCSSFSTLIIVLRISGMRTQTLR